MSKEQRIPLSHAKLDLALRANLPVQVSVGCAASAFPGDGRSR